MTPGELQAYCEVMQRFGIETLDVNGIQIRLPVREERMNVIPQFQGQTETLKPTKDPIAQKVEEMAAVIKMSDEELLDSLFPEMPAESA